MNRENYTPCGIKSRCKKWRLCDKCARIRQAQIANIAESGAKKSKNISMVVIRTYAEHRIGKDKASLIDKFTRNGAGGIWTIEQGEASDGLHINIIAGTDEPINAGEVAQLWKRDIDADIWAEPVNSEDVRRVAAYIAKRRQMPAKKRYAGRLYGSFGYWKKPLNLLAESKAPIVALAALNQIIKSEPNLARPMLARAERKEETAQRIAANRREISLNSAEKNKAMAEKTNLHALAMASGEIKENGFAYIAGHGIRNVSDLISAGMMTREEADKLA